MMSAGSCTLLGLFFLPETFAPVLLTRKAKRLRRANPEKNKDLYAESERVSWAARAVLERTIFRLRSAWSGMRGEAPPMRSLG
jgi:hypothetical protein